MFKKNIGTDADVLKKHRADASADGRCFSKSIFNVNNQRKSALFLSVSCCIWIILFFIFHQGFLLYLFYLLSDKIVSKSSLSLI